ncbi:RDD family protein [Janthinobacterium aquaticum]|uniref:RDD family protein n=1 Tax=Janthinobacterium sp. FT58W TaxID=2654254 RepID=UPI001265A59F|nr:RDD family protein [Janthinobacterium sp. FT58W]KAB8042415.1 RDD family protein [Janthinobacterium sp. FT58W]
MSNKSASTIAPATPTIKRRLISMVYESLLALAVLFLPFLLFELAVQGAHTPLTEHLRQCLAFLVMGAYFIHQWSREGQTLAMKTWRLKLVMPGHAHVPLRVAACRYVLAWMWLLPALIVSWAFELQHWSALSALGAGWLLWSATALFTGNGQFLHDKLIGTQIVQLAAPTKKSRKVVA